MLVLKFWNALEQKFRLYRVDNDEPQLLLLIAKLLFWRVYVGEPLDDHLGRQKRFVAFFGLKDE
jgi:hypothetical protein